MTPQAWLQQKLRQCVAGASAMVGDDVASSFAALVEEALVRRSLDDEGDNNVGLWNVRREWCEENGGEWLGEAAPCGDALVRGRWPSGGAFGIIIRAMWNGNRVSVSMRASKRNEADPWCSFIVDWMENWPSRGACGLLVRTELSSTKAITNADHENTSDLIMERYVTDLYCPGNDVTVSHSSANLKHENSGSEWQKTAMSEEALVDAVSLQQEFRRSFFLMLIIESRVGPVRLYNSKIYSATIKEQTMLHRSLQCNIQSARCAPGSATLFVSRPRRCIISVFNGIISHRLEIDLDVVALLCTPVDLLLFLNFGERGVFIQFMDLSRKLLLQVVAFLVKVPQFEVGMLMCFSILISQHKEPAIKQLHEMEHSPKN